MNNFTLFILILLFLFAGRLMAQNTKSNDSLAVQIAHLDSVMFNAFNNRDTATFKQLFTEELEFYHDKGGVTGYLHTIDFMRTTSKNNNGLRRDLVPGSLEVYPVPAFGAMEIGSHTFQHTENGQQVFGTFKFIHIWKKTPEGWKISRVISYGH